MKLHSSGESTTLTGRSPGARGFVDLLVEGFVGAGGEDQFHAVELAGIEGRLAMDDAVRMLQCREGVGKGFRRDNGNPGTGAEEQRGLARGGIAAADYEAVLAAQVEKNR